MPNFSLTQKCTLNILVSHLELLTLQQQYANNNPIYIRTANTDPFFMEHKTKPTNEDVQGIAKSLALLLSQKKLTVGDKRLCNRINTLVKQWQLPIKTATFRVPNNNLPPILMCCGPMASGKSYAAKYLGATLGYSYIESDMFHRQSSVDKMKTGVSITEDERTSYIASMCQVITAFQTLNIPTVLAFPAHTIKVRTALREQFPALRFIRFSASEEELVRRAKKRKHPYIKQGLEELIPKQVAINTPLTIVEVAAGHLEVPPEPALSTGGLLRMIVNHFRIKSKHGK